MNQTKKITTSIGEPEERSERRREAATSYQRKQGHDKKNRNRTGNKEYPLRTPNPEERGTPPEVISKEDYQPIRTNNRKPNSKEKNRKNPRTET